MSEETIEPCAWCGEPPERIAEYCEFELRHSCHISGCRKYMKSYWNEQQQRILAARRNDFEAGVLRASSFHDGIVNDGLLPSEALERLADEYIRGGE